MPKIDLADDELAAVVALVRRSLDEEKFPFSRRVRPLKAAPAVTTKKRP
jgi:hypothetical protein